MLALIANTTTAVSLPIDWGKWGAIAGIAVPLLGLIATAIVAYYRLGQVEKTIDTDIKPELKSLKSGIEKAKDDLGARIDKIYELLHTLKAAQSDTLLDQSGVVEANSPRQLNDKGLRILKESGIKELMDDKLPAAIDAVKVRKPENDYQIEQYVIDWAMTLRNDKSLEKQLEEGAFNSGSSVILLLLVGAIYLRDQVIAAINQSGKQTKN